METAVGPTKRRRCGSKDDPSLLVVVVVVGEGIGMDTAVGPTKTAVAVVELLFTSSSGHSGAIISSDDNDDPYDNVNVAAMVNMMAMSKSQYLAEEPLFLDEGMF